MISKLLPFLTIICAAAIFFGYVNPVYTTSIHDLSKQIDSYKGALIAADQFKTREASLLEERNSIDPEGLRRVEAFLPDGVDNVQLILDLNALASRTGMKITNFDVQAPNAIATSTSGSLSLGSPQSPTDSITLTLSATGTYDSLHTFMSAIEASLRPLDLVSFSLTNSETGVYSYQFTYRIYWLR